MIADLFRILFFRERDLRGATSVAMIRGEWPRAEAEPPPSRKHEPCRHCKALVSGAHACEEMRRFHAPKRQKRAPVAVLAERRRP